MIAGKVDVIVRDTLLTAQDRFNKNKLQVAAVLIAILSFVPISHADAESLDHFLMGFDDQCKFTPESLRLRGQIAEQYIGGVLGQDVLVARKNVPVELREVTGEIQIIEDTEDYVGIEILMQGRWRGVEVESIEFILGNYNGISVFVVNFKSPIRDVEAVFKSIVEKSAQRLANDPDNVSEIMTMLNVNDGKVSLVCDSST